MEDEKLGIKWIPSILIFANSFTKALLVSIFKSHQEK